MYKRILSVFITTILVLMLIPISASAVDMVVNTGVKHNWVLPVVLICVAVLVIVVLLVTKKKSDK